MSFLDRLTSTFGPVSPETIQRKIDEQTATLAGLENAVGDAAYAVEMGDAGAAHNLGVAQSALAETKARIDLLGRVLFRAIATQDAATEAAKEKLRQAQRTALQNHVRSRDEAGARLITALAEVATAYTDMIEATEEMSRTMVAIGAAPNPGGLETPYGVRAAVANEMYRTGGNRNKYYEVPNVQASRLEYHDAPEMVPPMAGLIQASREWLQRTILNPAKDTDHE